MVGTRDKATISFCWIEWTLLRTSTLQVRLSFKRSIKCQPLLIQSGSDFRNSVGSNTQLELATRFIALSTVGNGAKAKYVYALSIAPVDKMRLMDLIQKTTDETPCPYDSLNLMKDVVTKSEVIFCCFLSLPADQFQPKWQIRCRIIPLSFSTTPIRLTMTATEIHTRKGKDSDSTVNESARNMCLTKVSTYPLFTRFLLHRFEPKFFFCCRKMLVLSVFTIRGEAYGHFGWRQFLFGIG